MITLNFDEVLERTYNAKKGVDVRYGLGQGFEYCKQFADEAQGYATNAKASEKKATDAVAGIEQTKTDAVQAVQNAQTTATTAVQRAQSTATTAVTTKQTEAVQAIGTAQTGAVKAVDDERDAALQQVANSTKAAQTAASNAAASEQAAQASKEAAATSAGAAENSATAASGSASAAATSESNAASSAQSANTDADRAEAAAELAGTRANTDKTLKTENAPADAKAVGDIILDAEGNVIFYSKTAVDKLLAGKLDIKPASAEGLGSGLEIDGAGKLGTSFYNRGHVADANEANNPGWYSIPVGAANAPIVDAGQILSFSSAGHVWPCQIFLSSSTNGIHFRTFDGENWGAWIAAGIVASGGGYIRFGDGTQICFGAVQLSSGITARNTATLAFTFPMAFADANYIKTISQRNDPGGSWNVAVANTGMRTTGFDALIVNGDTTYALNAGAVFEYIAIGRWR